MPDYKIGSVKLEEALFDEEPVVLYFATLPYGGSMSELGRPGLYRIIAAIEKQYVDHKDELDSQIANDFSWLKEWMRRTAESAEVFDRVMFAMRENKVRRATLAGRTARIFRSTEDLQMFAIDQAAFREEKSADAAFDETSEIITPLPGQQI
ncbi:hypothetical protein HFN76_18355 [Rhizobium laguerreae]|uniref:hypothetical protein n=1 Tax=Rhizobium laguerreae TaxID=1076926 RepID=UPI001C901EF8|nr:hypothetical protein [Rhizobium laguerreae]MBY3514176.1 hypothetical protein [Rhizobium laguerreae]